MNAIPFDIVFVVMLSNDILEDDPYHPMEVNSWWSGVDKDKTR